MFDPLQRKDDERIASSQGRLPPGQSLTNRFPVLHYGQVPRVNLETWNLRIWGQVEKPVELTWQEFNQLPRRKISIDLHCVTRWSKLDTLWEGVSVRDMIEQGIFKPLPEGRYVMQHAEMGYTVNLPLEIVLADNFLLATHFNGEPIAPEHGYPLRGVVGAVPDRDKWLRSLEFMKEDNPGYWEQAGYHNDADAWKEQRYA